MQTTPNYNVNQYTNPQPPPGGYNNSVAVTFTRTLEYSAKLPVEAEYENVNTRGGATFCLKTRPVVSASTTGGNRGLETACSYSKYLQYDGICAAVDCCVWYTYTNMNILGFTLRILSMSAVLCGCSVLPIDITYQVSGVRYCSYSQYFDYCLFSGLSATTMRMHTVRVLFSQ